MNNDCDCIVSAIYTTFEVIDETVLLPEFLFLFFKDLSLIDTLVLTLGVARETFDWEDMCEVKIPIPDIKVQSYSFHFSYFRKSQKLERKIKR